ncbi:winged helix-turn-helix transcriptional regulator [Actinopolymorpha pittospori]|uniref:DNA-binding HxlR family transcriptional regulator n=1 Tax=Actinopolymorpha pittospori TaxID=648752 RepID=A0A927MV22_9ACTN|nr:helix-turn-helix domain-containing protein [Actinopolymorpha pittospori]MBE1605783.1 DNA-binding HxlR family transcriptional regulator [Actinopolymorpha pittospori]
MPVTFEGALADRSTWRVNHCSIAMAMEVIGSRTAMLVLREALYGTTRFDDFVRRTQSTDAVVASRLKQLTALGALAKQPYREAGKRTRDEYHLTAKGRDLLPVVFGLMQWGSRHLQPDGHGPLTLVERGTGARVVIEARSEDGRSLDLDDLAIVANFDAGEETEDLDVLD